LVLTLFILAYAASFTINQKQYTGEQGSHLTVTNRLLSIDKGFSKAQSAASAAGSCPVSNVTFASSAQIANTAIIPGNIVFDAQVNTTATTPSLSCFTVTLTLAPNSSPQTSYSLTIATDASPQANWTIDCRFDIGATLPTPPFSFKITVR